MTTIIRFARDPRTSMLRAIDAGKEPLPLEKANPGTLLRYLNDAIVAVLIWHQEREINGAVRSSPQNFDVVAAKLRAVDAVLTDAFERQAYLDNTDDADNLPDDIEFEPAPELADDVGGVVEFEAEFGGDVLPLCPDCGNAEGWGQSCARCRALYERGEETPREEASP